MQLIIIPIVLLIIALGIIWGSRAIFSGLDQKAGKRIGGPVIGLGVLVGLNTPIIMIVSRSVVKSDSWGYGSWEYAILIMASPVIVVLGFWVVLGAGCLVKAFMRDCRPIRNQAIGQAVLFWIIPGLIGIHQLFWWWVG